MRLALVIVTVAALTSACSKTDHKEPTQPPPPVSWSTRDAALGASSDAAPSRLAKPLENAAWEADVARYIIGQANKQLALLEVRPPNGVTLKIEAEGKAAADLQKTWTELHPEKGFDENVHAPSKPNERGPLQTQRFGPATDTWKLLLKEKLEARRFSIDAVPRWTDSAAPASMRELVAREGAEELGVISFADNRATLARSASTGGGLFFKSFFEAATSQPPLVVFYARPSAGAPDALVVARARPGDASYPATIRAYFATHINRYDRYVFTVVP